METPCSNQYGVPWPDWLSEVHINIVCDYRVFDTNSRQTTNLAAETASSMLGKTPDSVKDLTALSTRNHKRG